MQDILKRFCKEIDIMQGDSSDTFKLLLQVQNYIHSDPELCLVKIRQIIELFVDGMYKKYSLDSVSRGGGII